MRRAHGARAADAHCAGRSLFLSCQPFWDGADDDTRARARLWPFGPIPRPTGYGPYWRMRRVGPPMPRLFGSFLFLLGALAPRAACASFLHGDTLDAVANVLAWFILIVMPLAAIGIFLFVHVLPEVIAEKRQHPH